VYSKILAFLIVVVVLVGAAAGCGGGGQRDAQSQGSEQKSGKGKVGKERETKTESLDGTVARVLPEKNTVVVRPKDGGPVPFRYRAENLEVTLNGEEAKLEDIEKGQAASVEYVTRTTEKDREVNVARSIELQSRGGGNTGGEATG
jgi:hypothetical protein